MTHKQIKLTRTLTVDQEIFQFMMNTHSTIVSIMTNFEFTHGINYLGITDSDDKISYLPIEKFKEEFEFDPYAKKIGRVQIKIGRFIQKFIPQEVLEKMGVSKLDVEKFVNSYKSWFDKSKFKFEIVDGQKLKDAYYEANYYAPNGNLCGSLWNSCMRYFKRLKFLEMYIDNPNCKLLVMYQNQDDNWLIRGRALLWDDVTVIKDYSDSLPSKIKVMDRIYTVFDSDVDTFKKWASNNDYITKFEQNAKSHQFFDIKGQVTRLKCKINLENFRLSYYPYLDTFPWFNITKGELSNDEYGFPWDYKLVQANGDLEPPQQEENTDNDDW